jgi:V/A-type H+-transporting ATPase subunit I
MDPLIPLSNSPTSCFMFSLIVGVLVMIFSYSVAIWQLGFKINLTGNLFFILSIVFFLIGHKSLVFIFDFLGWGFLIIASILWIMFPVDAFGKDSKIPNLVLTFYNGVVGAIQDVFSHMRLFGISLSGAILVLVVNKIALMMPFVATVVFSFVAHITIFLLALMSMYVHSSRLIFLEFGSQFIKGGNSYYSPLSRSFLK